MRVLIVEDDPEINHLVAAYAQIAGAQADCALTGKAALALAARGPHDLAILDVMLPDIDGLEIARRLRADPATARMPLVILTALTAESTRRQANELGVQAFLNKPFDPDELIQVIRRCGKAPSS